jgi:hypothetical protein
MRGPPDPETNRGATANGTPNSSLHPYCTNITTEAASAYQAHSLIEVQVFCLARRCAISAPMALAIAPLIWGWRS